MNCNFEKVRCDFPFFTNHQKMVYLDNAATTQKPRTVIQKLNDYYQNENVNVHRGAYTLADRITVQYENVRQKVAKFIHADSEREVIFTAGTTEAINWVANGFFLKQLSAGDEIIVTTMEHHSNLLPWQSIAKKTGAKLKFVDFDRNYMLDIADLKDKISNKTRLIAVAAVSNVLGTINPIKEISKIAHQKNALILVDAAQAAPSMPLDVREWDADFIAFSGHKMLGPTGVGVLWGRKALLQDLEPQTYGGGMIDDVAKSEMILREVPWCFEGGTPNIAGVIGLGVAIDYLEHLGMENIYYREKELTDYLLTKMQQLQGLQIYASPQQSRIGIVSFNINKVHAHDVATVLDVQNVAIRTGHHCAIPLMKRLGITGTCRASVYFYNTKQEIDEFVKKIDQTREFFEVYG